ncbi:hypothetical protein M9H77_07412 [Catharanthus roseus]|uniref:Uncharacterized protein n=1 Tax=Catharanthus roseus TaxID=4058 RepID=A0ACC0BUU9_CATRO|nr:hypothetical protein M9H77_07412 [Catharanthus roseus]
MFEAVGGSNKGHVYGFGSQSVAVTAKCQEGNSSSSLVPSVSSTATHEACIERERRLYIHAAGTGEASIANAVASLVDVSELTILEGVSKFTIAGGTTVADGETKAVLKIIRCLETNVRFGINIASGFNTATTGRFHAAFEEFYPRLAAFYYFYIPKWLSTV